MGIEGQSPRLDDTLASIKATMAEFRAELAHLRGQAEFAIGSVENLKRELSPLWQDYLQRKGLLGVPGIDPAATEAPKASQEAGEGADAGETPSLAPVDKAQMLKILAEADAAEGLRGTPKDKAPLPPSGSAPRNSPSSFREYLAFLRDNATKAIETMEEDHER